MKMNKNKNNVVLFTWEKIKAWKRGKQLVESYRNMIWHLIFSLQALPKILDAQHNRADGDTELQDWQNNQHANDASQQHLVAQEQK